MRTEKAKNERRQRSNIHDNPELLEGVQNE